MRKIRLLLATLFVISGISNCIAAVGQPKVIGGAVEPDYKYPWVVRDDGAGCGGVLIEPRWVLTAAHCATPGLSEHRFYYTRKYPRLGALYTDSRLPAIGANGLPSVFIHPMYHGGDPYHDIALIKLASAFYIDSEIQTVGLPTSPRVGGEVGTVASRDQARQLPQGDIAVLRARIREDLSGPSFFTITTPSSGAWLCPGDSGSGFVTYENGRATVRGIASEATIVPDCLTTPPSEVDFVDVFNHRDWILQTMNASDASIVGNTRVHWTGGVLANHTPGGRGVMGIGCSNPYDTMWGPLYVVGVEVGANCESNDHEVVICSLDEEQPNSIVPMGITAFIMKTTVAGVTSVQSLPFFDNWAIFDGVLPEGATREFICQIGLKSLPVELMPNVIGSTEAAARNSIIAAGFVVGNVSRTVNSDQRVS